MVLKYKDKDIATLHDIQKLKAKDLRDIMRSHSESTGGMKADLVLKVYASFMLLFCHRLMQIARKIKKFLHLRTKSKVKTNATSNTKRP